MFKSDPLTDISERKEECHYTKAVRKRGRRPRTDPGRNLQRDDQNFGNRSPQNQSRSPGDTAISSNTSNQDVPSIISSLENRAYGLDANANDTGHNTSPSSAEKFATINPPFSAPKDPLSGIFETPLSNVRLETNQTAMSPSRVS